MPPRNKLYPIKHHRRKIQWAKWSLLIVAPPLSVAVSVLVAEVTQAPRTSVGVLVIFTLLFLFLAVYCAYLAWSAWAKPMDEYRRYLQRTLNANWRPDSASQKLWPGDFIVRLIRVGLPLAECAALFMLTVTVFALFHAIAAWPG
jgi:hypothetical protein